MSTVDPPYVPYAHLYSYHYHVAGLTRIEAGTGIGTPHYDASANFTGYDLIPPVSTAGYEAMFAKLKVLEIFKAQAFVNPPCGLSANPAWTDKPLYLNLKNPDALPVGVRIDDRPTEYVYNVNLSQALVDYINAACDALIEARRAASAEPPLALAVKPPKSPRSGCDRSGKRISRSAKCKSRKGYRAKNGSGRGYPWHSDQTVASRANLRGMCHG